MLTPVFFSFLLLLVGNAFGQTYQVFEGFDKNDCSGTPVVIIATLVDYCYPTIGDTANVLYHYDTCNTTTVSSSVFDATECVGLADVYDSSPTDTCQIVTTVDYGDVSGMYSCATEIPVYEGNYITNKYYASLDCSGEMFTSETNDFTWFNCFEGSKITCDTGDLIYEVCDDSACTRGCHFFGNVPSGSCFQSVDNPPVSQSFSCTSGAANVVFSIGLIVVAAAVATF